MLPFIQDGDEPICNILLWLLELGTKSKHSTWIFQVLLNAFSWINFSTSAGSRTDKQHEVASHYFKSQVLFMAADGKLRWETAQRGMARQTCVGPNCSCCQLLCQHTTKQLSHWDTLSMTSKRRMDSLCCPALVICWGLTAKIICYVLFSPDSSGQNFLLLV